LKIYYGTNPGVRLVEEGNMEALIIEALNILEKNEYNIAKH